MKTYKINNVEISAEQIKDIIKNNPELLNENKGGRYFFPEKDERFWHILTDGFVNDISCKHPISSNIILQGVYRTKEEAQLASAKQRAIVACWKWAQENAPFEPDWGDDEQRKYLAYLNHDLQEYCWTWSSGNQSQFTLPYLKSIKDCEAFIEANREHLELLFKR